MNFKKPLLMGFAFLILSQVVLITVPRMNYLWLVLSVFLEACSAGTVNLFTDKLVVISVDAKERARIMAIIGVVIILFTSPFGWITGSLSEINKVLPFILRIILFAIGGLLTYLASKTPASSPSPELPIATPQ